jgi:hypothetical protein
MRDDHAKDAAALAVYVGAAAAQAGLSLDRQSLAAVMMHARILARFYDQFADLPLADATDPAALLRL